MGSKRLLTDLAGSLAQAGYESPNYRALYEAARSAQIPCNRGSNGRWEFDVRDIDEIAKLLGLDSCICSSARLVQAAGEGDG